MFKNQKGFTALEAILIIVIIAVVGFAGWYVYKANNKKDDNKTTTSQQANNTDGSKQEPAKENKKTLSIKEWGVQAQYASDQNLVYRINEAGSAFFSSTELKAQGGAGCSEENGGGGAIQRLKPTDGTYVDGEGPTAEEAAKTSSDFKKVGDYYYRFIHSQAACGDTTEKTAQAQQTVNDLVKSIVPTLKAAQ